MKKVVLIDVSNLFFRSFHAVPKHFTMKDGTPSNAVYGVVSTVFSLLESEQATHFFAARDLRGPTFRHEEMEGYKAGRPEMPEDLATQLPFVFSFFTEGMELPLLSKEGFEADDILATIAEHFRNQAETEIVIFSGDQDLFQIVGENVTVLYPQNGGKLPKRMNAEAVYEKMGVSPEQVPDYKAIAGDTSDRIPGVPGIGPVGAQKILAEYTTVENALEHATEIGGKNGSLLQEHKESALLSKKMAVLHKDLDIVDFCEDIGKIPNSMPKNLPDFLENISSRRLLSRAEKIFGQTEPPPEQLGLF